MSNSKFIYPLSNLSSKSFINIFSRRASPFFLYSPQHMFLRWYNFSLRGSIELRTERHSLTIKSKVSLWEERNQLVSTGNYNSLLSRVQWFFVPTTNSFIRYCSRRVLVRGLRHENDNDDDDTLLMSCRSLSAFQLRWQYISIENWFI